MRLRPGPTRDGDLVEGPLLFAGGVVEVAGPSRALLTSSLGAGMAWLAGPSSTVPSWQRLRNGVRSRWPTLLARRVWTEAARGIRARPGCSRVWRRARGRTARPVGGRSFRRYRRGRGSAAGAPSDATHGPCAFDEGVVRDVRNRKRPAERQHERRAPRGRRDRRRPGRLGGRLLSWLSRAAVSRSSKPRASRERLGARAGTRSSCSPRRAIPGFRGSTSRATLTATRSATRSRTTSATTPSGLSCRSSWAALCARSRRPTADIS